jgi:hypothetical protein
LFRSSLRTGDDFAYRDQKAEGGFALVEVCEEAFAHSTSVLVQRYTRRSDRPLVWGEDRKADAQASLADFITKAAVQRLFTRSGRKACGVTLTEEENERLILCVLAEDSDEEEGQSGDEAELMGERDLEGDESDEELEQTRRPTKVARTG